MAAAVNHPNVSIQINGITDIPVVLASSQLHGNRMLLLNNTESVQLHIRPMKRSCVCHAKGHVHGLESTTKTLHRRRLPGVCMQVGTYPWMQVTHADPVDPSYPRWPTGHQPTIFQDRVYNHIQHGLISLLLWSLGGLSHSVQYVTRSQRTKKNEMKCAVLFATSIHAVQVISPTF